MRDDEIRAQMALAEDALETCWQRLRRTADHARANDAPAHGDLYDHVAGHIHGAIKDMQRAYAIMLNGEPSDYEGAA